LVAVFNDKDSDNTQSLQTSIESLAGIADLKNPPRIYNNEIGTEIVKSFEDAKLVPTLCFVDPWGYKGLSLRLINAVLKDWACECVFFFNYNRINMGLGNKLVLEHMQALFDEERTAILAENLKNLTPDEREATIVEEICNALKDAAQGNRYVLPFGFKDEHGNRTRHHLIFVSKNFKGYEVPPFR
jgi:three-Cys-motif partner protein